MLTHQYNKHPFLNLEYLPLVIQNPKGVDNTHGKTLKVWDPLTIIHNNKDVCVKFSIRYLRIRRSLNIVVG